MFSDFTLLIKTQEYFRFKCQHFENLKFVLTNGLWKSIEFHLEFSKVLKSDIYEDQKQHMVTKTNGLAMFIIKWCVYVSEKQ